jgi:hypothetical protein
MAIEQHDAAIPTGDARLIIARIAEVTRTAAGDSATVK